VVSGWAGARTNPILPLAGRKNDGQGAADSVGLPPFDPDAPAWRRAEPVLPEQPPPFDDLGALYDACGSAVYRLAQRLSRSSQEAEDLTHDVFLRYWQQGRYEPARGPVLAYLLLLTRSMAINRLNQRRNRWQLLQRWSEQLLPASVTSPQESAEHTNLAERVRAALAAIPANQRQVLELAYYEGLSQSVIGERLQLPLGTVKTRSRQGLMRLRELLIDFGNEP
jgi:RNA polymerase sigma-70 factor (ECF subfamily)